MSKPDMGQSVAGKDSMRKNVWMFTVMTAFIPVLSLLGLFCREKIEFILNYFAPDWALPYPQQEEISSLWIAVVSIHGAIGAIAPVLGYTLLTTAATPSVRIAPAGFVVADAIQWRNYLIQSLSLLAGSLIGLVLVPSFIGLCCALIAAWFIIFETFKVFRNGFELLQREDKFDESARKYLKKIVTNVQSAPKIDSNLSKELADFNKWILALNEMDSTKEDAYGLLYIGDRSRPTEIIEAQPRAGERLASMASSLGVQISRVKSALAPESMAKGSRVILAVSKLGDVNQVVGIDRPLQSVDFKVVQDKKIEKIQDFLYQLIVYGKSDWASEQVRIQMLVHQHLTTMLCESIPRQMPHDLRYGLDVLGDVIDELTKNDLHGAAFELETYRWVYSTPAFLVRQVCEVDQQDIVYAVDIISFIRSRLKLWMHDVRRDSITRAYLGLLERLFVSSMVYGKHHAESLSVYIREIPITAARNTHRAVVFLSRSIIISFLDAKLIENAFYPSRRVALKTLSDTVSFSGFNNNLREETKVEVAISVLATSMYMASQNPLYLGHVKQVFTEYLHEDFDFDSGPMKYVDLINRVDSMIENWRWDWWEINQKEQGRAHFMSMHIWVVRACAILISKTVWLLRRVEPENLPVLDVLFRIKNAIADDETHWKGILEHSGINIDALEAEIENAEARRKEFVDEKVSKSPVDLGKCQNYVHETISEIIETYGSYSSWLDATGCVYVAGRGADKYEHGSARLVPREWFVPDNVLDIPISVFPTDLGRGVVDSEVRKIAHTLLDGAEGVRQVSSSSDIDIWIAANEILQKYKTGVLIIGFGIPEHEVWEQLEDLKRRAGINAFEYISVRSDNDETIGRNIILVHAKSVFELHRYPLLEHPYEPIVAESIALKLGGVTLDISEINSNEKEKWLANVDAQNKEALLESYTRNLAFRIRWSFSVRQIEREGLYIFRLSAESGLAERP